MACSGRSSRASSEAASALVGEERRIARPGLRVRQGGLRVTSGQRLEAGAISAISVSEVKDEYAYSVAASYKIGNQAVNADFPVEKSGDVWKLREVAYDLTLTSVQNWTLPLLIKGVKADADKVSVFPGGHIIKR